MASKQSNTEHFVDFKIGRKYIDLVASV
jgi:hypothetical protein